MTDHTYLIEKLREYTGPWLVPAKAADALAALVKERDTLVECDRSLKDQLYAALARVKRLEDAIKLCFHADNVFMNGVKPCRCPRCSTLRAALEGDKP